MALRDGCTVEIDLPNRHIVFEGERYPLRGGLDDPERGKVRFTADPDTGETFLVYEDGRLVSLGDMRLGDPA